MNLLNHKVVEINKLLEKLSSESFSHEKHYRLFREKYSLLKTAIDNSQTSLIKEICLWNKNYAPRIIYEGYNNNELLNLVASLDNAATEAGAI